MKQDILRKLTSRKLWVALADFVGMLIVAFGVAEETAAQVAAIIMAGAGVLGYLLAEGLVDKAGAEVSSFYVTASDSNSAGDRQCEPFHPPEGEDDGVDLDEVDEGGNG